MSQPHPSQHLAVNDMQFWQQKVMHKQLQDLQRQQLQHDSGTRGLNPFNQLSASTKPVALNQPEMMNEMPTHNSLNYMWPNNFAGPDNSHMLVAGNMNRPNLASSSAMRNIANGIVVSNDQSPSVISMRYYPDQSFHDIPISNTRGSTNHNSQFSEMSNDCNNLMTKEGGSQSEKASGQFNSFQNNEHFIPQSCLEDTNLGTAHSFREKRFFGHVSMEMLNGDDTTVSFRQTNGVQCGQNQAFHARKEQHDWSGVMQEKPEEQVEASKYVASLDPAEQNFLFGTDEDNWGASFSGSINSGAGSFLQGLPLANDYLSGFPSIQSGSWSALMQEAVQSSTSDKETQEEWSGLDFQKMEQSVFKHSVMSNDSVKQLTAWNDSNLQSVSLTTKPLTLFNDIESEPSPCNAPTFQASTPAEHSSTQADASHLSFQLSSRHTCDKQFHQVQKQNQLPDVGQVQVPKNNEMWVGQTYQQHENNSSDMQNIPGGWTQQQDLHLSNNAKGAGNRPNDWNSNYQVGVGNSRLFGGDNIQSNSTSHANMNNVVQSVGNKIVQVHSEGSFLGNCSSIPTWNAENNQQMTSLQNVAFGKMFALDSCINSEGEQNVKKGNNQQSGRQQSWELPTKSVNKRQGDNCDNNKVHAKVVSDECYISSRIYGHQSSIINDEKKISSLIGHDQHSNLHECHKPATHPDKQTVMYNMFQNQVSNLGMNLESSYPGKNVSHFHEASDSIVQGSKTEGNILAEKSKFNDPLFCNATMDPTKGTMVTGTDERQSSNAILAHNSASIDRSAVNYSQSKNIAQRSQNMLELLHKVDHSGNCSSVPDTDKSLESVVNTSLFNQSSGMQSFGLQLAPPSQRQQPSCLAMSSQMSINDVKNSRQLNQEARDNDQMPSTYAPPSRFLPSNEASKRDNVSSISGERHKESSESREQLRSPLAIVSGLPYLRKEQQTEILSGKYFLLHQQHHKKYVSSSTEHEVSHQSVEFPLGNQINEHSVGKCSPQWKPQNSLDGVVTSQSVPASLPTPVRGIPPSRLVPLADTHVSANSKFPLVTDNMKKVVAVFPQVQSSYSFTEGRSGLQPSVAGMVQQADFSRRLQNLSNISAQQRLAGLHPAILTPQLLQSIINNNRDTSSWGLQKGDDQGSKGENIPEMSTGYYNVGHGDEHLIKNDSFKLLQANVDSAPKTVTSSQGEEVAQRAPPGGGSNFSVSSLVRLHQQDMDIDKGGHESAAHFRSVDTSTPNMPSTNSDIGFSGNTSISLDARQQSFSLLHQIQTMKGSDSDPSKMLEKSLKGTDDTSNTPQMRWNASHKSAYVQNPSFRVPADSKIGASSQGAFSSDVKMLRFGSKHSEKNSSTFAATAEEHDLQNSMQILSTTSAANSFLGTEQTQISSQMASSWFEKYGNYKNGSVIAGNFNDQLSVNASAEQCFVPKIPRMGYNLIVDQRSDGNAILTHAKNRVPSNLAASGEISSYIPLPTVLDHGIDQRPKKRKRSTSKIPWHKLVTEGPLNLLNISTEHWDQAANRLIEKVGDESETMEDSLSVVQSRKRLILTTQLAQQLLPAVPARILREEPTSSYESIVFYVAKGVLADACGMLSLAARNSDANLENQSWTIRKLKMSVVHNVMEDFMERSRKLESDFLRSEKKTSLLDVRLECQELERFSIVNRLGKFHGRPHTDVVEGSSNPEAASRRIFLQRYVTALPLQGSPPEGIACLPI